MRDDDDRPREECGVFGVLGHDDAAALTALGLHALQHRGQESAGIVTFDGTHFHSERRLGLVGDNFNKADVIGRLKGHLAVGHNRYSTTGDTILRNVQPLFADLDTGGFALAHNGNLTNARTLRRELISSGAICQSTSDTEVILHLMARSQRRRIVERFVEALRQIQGAYALVCITNDMMIGARDPIGIRPLMLGRLGSNYVLASETCALDMVGAELFAANVDLLRPDGRLVVIATMSGHRVEADLRALMLKRLTLTASTLRARDADEKARLARAVEERVWPWIEAGRVRPIIDRTFPLESAGEAHAWLERGAQFGKVVLTVD